MMTIWYHYYHNYDDYYYYYYNYYQSLTQHFSVLLKQLETDSLLVVQLTSSKHRALVDCNECNKNGV